MDRALYVGMAGAMQIMRAQTANNNNIANAKTIGFHAELVNAQPVPVTGTGLSSRVNVQLLDSGSDSASGPIIDTGNPLDIALENNDWLAVQASDGTEAYTKAGNLRVDSAGTLLTSAGQIVLGDGGPITLPPNAKVDIGRDGTISMVPAGSAPNALAVVGRLKVVEAEPGQMVRRADGLMAPGGGVTLNEASGNSVRSGALEESNVNLAASMMNMIQLARQFELQTKLMHATDTNAAAASSLVKMSG